MVPQEKIDDMVDAMPAFSNSVMRVLDLTADINCSPRDIVAVIDHDPVMTMKILKLVNSAYFGLRQEVVSIKQGVVMLGINTVKNLAITIAAVGMLPRNSIEGFDSQEFLLHSLGTATLSRILSHRIGIPAKESTDYFVAGLLHDFGKVVMVQSMPEEMEQALNKAANEDIDLCVAEQEIFGSTHADFGAMLASKWQLPAALINSIGEHHELRTEDQDCPMRDCVVAANILTKKIAFGNSGNPQVTDLPAQVASRFGCNADDLLAQIENIDEQLEKTRSFASV
ncbi:MAG: HDOD domain-containing protein [Pseudomonadales bacterium]|nr:HDOD domain-containing protein [Pseudomonadales bacterium]